MIDTSVSYTYLTDMSDALLTNCIIQDTAATKYEESRNLSSCIGCLTFDKQEGR